MSAPVRPPDGADDREAEARRARFRRVDALVDAALDRPPAERTAFVDASTADAPSVGVEARALLRAQDEAGPFLEAPAVPDALQRRLARALAGRYAVRRRVGAGGMARVYLADDLRHGRTVAVKAVAPAADPLGADALGAVAFGPDAPGADAPGGGAAARFLAEVRVMARLRHPHLLPLFDSGLADGVPYLVMPYVEGGTLRQRLAAEGPLPVAEAVRLARAVAGALAHAHAAGVVHRDLKPENVLLADGEPLVADFGVALAAADARLTGSGLLLGTPRYMAPEQASGDAAPDARTDVYALGVLLYEMLTGDPPHVASTPQAVLAKVRAERATPVHLLRDAVPPHVAAAVHRALAKHPADRFPTAAAFRDALTAPAPDAPAPGTGSTPPARPASRRPRARRRVIAGAAVAGVAVAGAAAGWSATRAGRAATGATPPAGAAARFVVAPVPEAAAGRAPALTPDGRTLVYAGAASTGRRLFVRPVGALAARALPGTAGALGAVISPDGRTAAYVTEDDRLLRVALDGGAPVALAGVFRYSQVAWAGAERLVVARHGADGLAWLPADGGAARRLTHLDTDRDESGHHAPFVLPDGRTVVFTLGRDLAGPGAGGGELALVTLDPARGGPAPHVRLGAPARLAVGWVDGWLLYVSPDGARVLARRLDLAGRRLVGPAVPVLEHPDGGIVAAALGGDGTLLYTRQQPLNAPVFVDGAGRATPIAGVRAGRYMNPRLSPDGRRLATQVADAQGNDAWVHDLATGTATRVTRAGGALSPTWTPDGRHLVYWSPAGGRDAVWRVAADGRAPPERVVEASGVFAPFVAPDGREVLFQRNVGGTWGIWAAPLVGPPAARRPRPVVVGRASACMPALSPDGRWLAYASNASGRYEVWVRPYPGPGADVQVSHDGGTEPAWGADGRHLYFRGDRRLHVATLGPGAPGAGPVVRDVRVRFTDGFDGDMPMPHRNYDVTRGGGRFVMIGSAAGDAAETVVVLGWGDELRGRLGLRRGPRRAAP